MFCAAQAYPKELMQCMLDVSSQTADDPFYQRIVYLVKALVSTTHLLQLKLLSPPVLDVAASSWQDRIAMYDEHAKLLRSQPA